MENTIPTIRELSEMTMREQLETVLLHSKATLLEGMIFERILEKKFFPKAPASLAGIPCTAMVARGSRGAPYLVFVWFTGDTPFKKRLLDRLAIRYKVVEITFDVAQMDFTVVSGHGASAGELLESYLARITGRAPTIEERKISKDDVDRQLKACWGYLALDKPAEFFQLTILPRVLKDFRIEPYTQGCWDLDRFFSYKNEIWTLEIKHKFPASEGYFGLNKGQVAQVSAIVRAGIRYFHLVWVKPYWNKDHSSVELLVDQSVAEHVAIIGAELTPAVVRALWNMEDKTAPEWTSLTGKVKQKCKPLTVDHFFGAGLYSEPANKVWPRILNLLDGKHPESGPMTIARLKKVRLEGPRPRGTRALNRAAVA